MATDKKTTVVSSAPVETPEVVNYIVDNNINNLEAPDLPIGTPAPMVVYTPTAAPIPVALKTPLSNFTYSDVRNLQRKGNGISCEVKFDANTDYWNFFAMENDVADHGQTIYAECVAGKWGPIKDYYPTDAEMLAAAQDRITRELGKADVNVTLYQDRVDIDDATPADVAALKAWKTYRVGLNRVPSQTGYPNSITWPVSP